MTTTTMMNTSSCTDMAAAGMMNMKEKKHHHVRKPTGEAAALELWDMIQSSSTAAPISKNRFAGAQQNRTLHHKNLPQPVSQEEEEQEARLCKRLSKALLAASPSGNLLLDMESPTSTLQFPSNNITYKNDIEGGPSPTSTLHFPSNYYDDEPEQEQVVIKQDAYQEPILVKQEAYQEPLVIQQEPIIIQQDVQEDVLDNIVIQKGTEMETHSPEHSFVVCADTQLGMTSSNQEWETELDYSRKAVQLLNTIQPRPAFCCVCGDLVDMQHSFYTSKGWNKEDCDKVQDQQNADFQRVWNQVHEDIALVCLCGNHDVGNRPNQASIEKYKRAFGDDYLAFWVNGTYNIVLNSNLFGDPTDALREYKEQLEWLEERLEYASQHGATQIFVFGHHPWFLYHEDEDDDELDGLSPYPKEWNVDSGGFYDYYFHIPKRYRQEALRLFCQYNVTACFSGHFHQNLVSKTSWGMDMIVTAPLSMVFESSGKPQSDETNARGVRIVTVDTKTKSFVHHFEPL